MSRDRTAFHGGGQRFESVSAYHSPPNQTPPVVRRAAFFVAALLTREHARGHHDAHPLDVVARRNRVSVREYSVRELGDRLGVGVVALRIERLSPDQI